MREHTRPSRTHSEAALSRRLCQPGPLEMVQKLLHRRTSWGPSVVPTGGGVPACWPATSFWRLGQAQSEGWWLFPFPAPHPHLPDRILPQPLLLPGPPVGWWHPSPFSGTPDLHISSLLGLSGWHLPTLHNRNQLTRSSLGLPGLYSRPRNDSRPETGAPPWLLLCVCVC